jgi:uncharacterized protein (TIGR00730 family)
MNTTQHPLGENASVYEVKEYFDKKRVNEREANLPDLYRADLHMEEMLRDKSEDCAEELLAGFKAISQYPKTATIFGSARTKEGELYYEKARTVAGKICQEGLAVVTGGGPGIMEAANRGSKETCGYSVGFNIVLPNEQVINPYVTHGVDFKFFSARKMAMFFSAEVYLYFPGGFGTLDEFFQLVTLIQTNKAPKTPIILVGKDYWGPLENVIEETLRDSFKTISPEDVNLYTITDDEDEILEIVRNAPERGKYE